MRPESKEILQSLQQVEDHSILEEVYSGLGEYLQYGQATVRYAGELDTTTRKEIEEKLLNQFPEMGTVEFIEDPSLIAGLKISYKDYLYEDSVSSRFQRLKQTL